MLFHLLDVVTLFVLTLFNILAAIHILLTKKEPRAALCWIAVCFAAPGVGVVLYLIFGVNRIKTVATQWQTESRFYHHHGDLENPDEEQLPEYRPAVPDFERMRHLADKICDYPLLGGCHVEPLINGTETYPKMIEAIDQAADRVYLASYIFSPKGIGGELIDALERAHHRGVEVRVLIDGIGVLYAFPNAYRALKKRKVPVALFLPPFKSWYHTLHLNLRCHRKLLIVDGCIGFTGGMNIHPDDYAEEGKEPGILDIHYRLEGPVVGHLQDTFVRSWYFSTKELMRQVFDFDADAKGNMLCRGVDGGPSRKFPRYSLMIRSALCSAQKNIRIMTPYLILDDAMRTAFTTAALRGIKVEVIMPKNNNLSFVQWASESVFPTLLKCDVDLYYRTGNFAHTKLLVMDDQYVLFGSSNIDNRSMYLNFEFDCEVYSEKLAKQLITHFESVKSKAHQLTSEELQNRSLGTKLRNAIFNLFSPYM